jgi:hypothetical protein
MQVIDMVDPQDNLDVDKLLSNAEQLLRRHRDYQLTVTSEPVRLKDFALFAQRVKVPLQPEGKHNETETLNRWLDGRVKGLVRKLNPLHPDDAIAACALMFFHAYYVEAVATRSHICSTESQSGMRFPTIAALQDEWEIFSDIRITDLPKPTLTAKEQSSLSNLLPMSERSVTNYVRRGLQIVFELQPPKPNPKSSSAQQPFGKPETAFNQPPIDRANDTVFEQSADNYEPDLGAQGTSNVIDHLPEDARALFEILAHLPNAWTWSPRSAAYLGNVSEQKARRAIRLMQTEGLVTEYGGRHGEPELRIAEQWHAGPDNLDDEHRDLLGKLSVMPRSGINFFGDYKGHREYPDLSAMVHGKPYEWKQWVQSSYQPLTNQVKVQSGVRPTFFSELRAASGAEMLLRKYGQTEIILDWLETHHKTLWIDQIPAMAVLERRLRFWRIVQVIMIVLSVTLIALTGYLSLTASHTSAGRYAIVGSIIGVFIALLALAGSGVLAFKHRHSWIRILWEFGIAPEGR